MHLKIKDVAKVGLSRGSKAIGDKSSGHLDSC